MKLERRKADPIKAFETECVNKNPVQSNGNNRGFCDLNPSVKTQSTDTHPEVERVHVQLLRQAGREKRLALAWSLSQSAVEMSRNALRTRYPDLSERERAVMLFSFCHGEKLAQQLRTYLEDRNKA